MALVSPVWDGQVMQLPLKVQWKSEYGFQRSAFIGSACTVGKGVDC